MKHFLRLLLVVLFGSAFTFADIPFESIGQIVVYEYDEIFDSYTPISIASAVVLWDQVLTNAHVVMDLSIGKVYENIELCLTKNTRERPQCGYYPKLDSVDIDNDLALLELDTNVTGVTVEFMDDDLDIWSSVSLVGYPVNGWETLTLTNWQVSGFDSWFYKVDANIDSWNSWWWAFDDDWRLVGIPSFAIDWLSTLWYIIPIKTIRDFMDWASVIDSFDQSINTAFVQYQESLLEIARTWTINNKSIDLSSSNSYWFNFIYGWESKKYDSFHYQFLNETEDTLVEIEKFSTLHWDITRLLQDDFIEDAKNDFDILHDDHRELLQLILEWCSLIVPIEMIL